VLIVYPPLLGKAASTLLNGFCVKQEELGLRLQKGAVGRAKSYIKLLSSSSFKQVYGTVEGCVIVINGYASQKIIVE
jgi:hypothetical protein